MQEWTLPNLVPKASRTPFLLSLLFLVGIVTVSVGLFSYTMILSAKSGNLTEKISAKTAEIAEVSNDKKVIITKILQSNTIRPTLDLKGIIANFRDAASRANVRLKGFQISKDIISTSLIATVGNTVHPDPASTIITMMRNYASTNGDGRFTLEPITSISGNLKSRTTAITLKVVPTSPLK